MEQPSVVAGNFALSFSLIFFSIFVHISGSIRPITLIWDHWRDLSSNLVPRVRSRERTLGTRLLFLLQKLNIDDANFGQKWWRQKWKKGQSSSRPVAAGTGVNGLILLAFYHECRFVIGYTTHYLFCALVNNITVLLGVFEVSLKRI